MPKSKREEKSGPCIIMVRSESDLAKLIDLVRANPTKAGQALYDASARWEQLYFGEPTEQPAVKTFFEPVMMQVEGNTIRWQRGGRIKCRNMLKTE